MVAIRPKRITGCRRIMFVAANRRSMSSARLQESRHTLGTQESHKSQQTEGLFVSDRRHSIWSPGKNAAVTK